MVTGIRHGCWRNPEALNTFKLSLAPRVAASLRSGFAVSLKDAGTRRGGGGGGSGQRRGDLVFMSHLKHAEWTRAPERHINQTQLLSLRSRRD